VVESGKVVLQVIIGVFSGAVEKIFDQRWLSPLEKNWPVRLWPDNNNRSFSVAVRSDKKRMVQPTWHIISKQRVIWQWS